MTETNKLYWSYVTYATLSNIKIVISSSFSTECQILTNLDILVYPEKPVDRSQWNGCVVFKVSILAFRQYFQPINSFETSQIFKENTTFYDCIPLLYFRHKTTYYDRGQRYDFIQLFTTVENSWLWNVMVFHLRNRQQSYEVVESCKW